MDVVSKSDVVYLESRLLDFWADVVRELHPQGNSACVTPETNLLDSGASSLLGMMLITRIYDELGIELPLGALLAKPTIRELALEIRECSLNAE